VCVDYRHILREDTVGEAMSREAAYLSALMSIRGVGPLGAVSVARRFETAEGLAETSYTDLQEALGQRVAAPIREQLDNGWRSLLSKAETRIGEHLRLGIRPVAITECDYPPLLRHIADPPAILYVKGDIAAVTDLNSIAVIGTRRPTERGARLAATVARRLASSGFVVISGLAIGIDAAAQRAAAEVGRTVAVLANPLNTVYPAENRHLAERIQERNGALVSELALGEKTFRNAFVRRDRIQSGMSVAVIPIQTDIEGGTMHTVRFAEDQKRLLFCPVPLQEESEEKQYAGIWNLIRSNRAKPFKEDGFREMIVTVNEYKMKLKNDFGLSDMGIPEKHDVDATHEGTSIEKSNSERPAAVDTVQKLEETFRDLGLDVDRDAFKKVVSELTKRLFGKPKRTRKTRVKSAVDNQPGLLD
jgi:DNA processing protein